jgi:hypothetical protein
VDGGVLVLADDHDRWLVRQGDGVPDGRRVVQPAAAGAVGGVQVGEVDARRVRRGQAQVGHAGELPNQGLAGVQPLGVHPGDGHLPRGEAGCVAVGQPVRGPAPQVEVEIQVEVGELLHRGQGPVGGRQVRVVVGEDRCRTPHRAAQARQSVTSCMAAGKSAASSAEDG